MEFTNNFEQSLVDNKDLLEKLSKIGINPKAGDDAKKIVIIDVDKILSADYAMPFCHISFLIEALRKLDYHTTETNNNLIKIKKEWEERGHNSEMIELVMNYEKEREYNRMNVLIEISMYRNIILMLRLNEKIHMVNKKLGDLLSQKITKEQLDTNDTIDKIVLELLNKSIFYVTPKEITPKMIEIIQKKETFLHEKLNNNINLEKYISFDNNELSHVKSIYYDKVNYNGNQEIEKCIEKDVNDCFNTWCLTQLETPGEATDNVILIRQNDKIYLLSIIRENGPGCNNVAYPGGFVDVKNSGEKETDLECGSRELIEETGIDDSKLKCIKFQILQKNYDLWDPRPRFYKHGMNVSANVIVIDV
jgi:hypothetical protein